MTDIEALIANQEKIVDAINNLKKRLDKIEKWNLTI
jgi:hypothetical protein